VKPGGGGPPNLQALLKQAQQMQRDLAAAQDELASAEIEGSAGGGLVTATVTGTSEVVSIRIDRQVVDPDDVDTLEDLVVAAINDATRQAQQLQAEKMGPLTGGLGDSLGLPGLG
jgi:DNA-binding YbaB/EbfC family protein